ncbi:phage minor head protein [Mesorhizobium sp. M0106]|uniref:phage head morphogenesis protein n=1 Tax=Mesorhizobium sp. M0106 TaxID=2956880 RepID=UPI003337D77E
MTADLKPLPPADAIAALFARGQRLDPEFSWLDTWQDVHARSFTVAKSAGFDILGDIYQALLVALSQGKTFAQFGAELTPLLQTKGWWGQQPAFDPLSGETRWSQLGSVRRLTTIFDINMRVSYAAGHWSSFERNKATRPFLRYVHLEGQEHPRPLHALWHNTVLPVDHPWWNTHACPNGWNCHCTLQSLSQRDIDRLQREGEILKFEPVSGTMRKLVNNRTGEVTTVPDGIDPGWAYNPGKAGYLSVVEQDLARKTSTSEWLPPSP